MKPKGKHLDNRLTPLTVRRLGPGRHHDGRGLYLLVEEPNSRRWLLRIMRHGRRRDIGLGSAHDLSLGEAREIAQRLRKAVKIDGRDPIAERRAQRAVPTFGDFADEYIAAHRAGWKNAKHIQQWENTLKGHASPLRPKLINTIDTNDVLAVIRPLWKTKQETAARLRGRIEAILDAAKVEGHRAGENPARWRGHLEHSLSERKAQKNHRALPYERVPEFMAALRAERDEAARLLEFTILTAARSGEARGARVAEFDLDKLAWTVPPERMKSGREHRVPLSARAVAIVNDGAKDGLVFQGRKKGETFSDGAMSELLKRMGFADVATVHGFRATFRTWAEDTTSFPRNICEAALAHTVRDKTERSYQRGDLFEKRRALMDAWESYCASSGARVVNLAGRRGR